MQFASLFPDIKIVTPLVTQLSWTHFLLVMPIKDPLAREFYLTMAANERWSKRTLEAKIDSMLYERTAVATKPEELIKQELTELRENNVLTPDLVFKSPYFLGFTGLKGMYSEKSLEDSLVAHLEQFILELGNGFTFVERQKRMIIDGEDFYLDLLFYHRKMHRLIAIELKLGKFKAQYKGQMELYLRWLEAHEMEPGEEQPLGLLLCTEGGDEHEAVERGTHQLVKFINIDIPSCSTGFLKAALHPIFSLFLRSCSIKSLPIIQCSIRLTYYRLFDYFKTSMVQFHDTLFLRSDMYSSMSSISQW